MPKDKHLDDVRFQPGIVQSTTEVAQRSAYKWMKVLWCVAVTDMDTS
jgi:hypothetical protein